MALDATSVWHAWGRPRPRVGVGEASGVARLFPALHSLSLRRAGGIVGRKVARGTHRHVSILNYGLAFRHLFWERSEGVKSCERVRIAVIKGSVELNTPGRRYRGREVQLACLVAVGYENRFGWPIFDASSDYYLLHQMGRA